MNENAKYFLIGFACIVLGTALCWRVGTWTSIWFGLDLVPGASSDVFGGIVQGCIVLTSIAFAGCVCCWVGMVICYQFKVEE